MPSDVDNGRLLELESSAGKEAIDGGGGGPRRTTRRGLSRLAALVMPSTDVAPDRLAPTAYLDGLRGFAAFLVYWHHHHLWVLSDERRRILNLGFGFGQQHHLVTLPLVRTFFAGGHFAVATFFVISGFVLARKPLKLMQAVEQAELADNLASALFRRWLRLFMPLVATTFIYMSLWHVFGGIWVEGAKPQSTYRDELYWWYAELKNFSFVFNGGGEPWLSYNFHLWSIPVEMRGSVVVYTVLLAVSRCTRNWRLACTAALVFYFLYVADGWFCALFTAGMLLSDLDLLAAKDELPSWAKELWKHRTAWSYHLLLVGLYLGGVPSDTANLDDLRACRGWYYLAWFKPQAVFDYKWFYLFYAAVFLVASVPHIGWLRRFFETRFCQALGRISYALYLVHGPVLWTLGDRLYAAVGWAKDAQRLAIPQWVDRLPLSTAGPLGLEPAFWLPQLVLLPVTLWLAEMVTSLIDEPAVRFAQRLYARTSPRPVGRLPA